jgi:hypothetical protein
VSTILHWLLKIQKNEKLTIATGKDLGDGAGRWQRSRRSYESGGSARRGSLRCERPWWGPSSLSASARRRQQGSRPSRSHRGWGARGWARFLTPEI